jgi:hypothetical protein
MRDLKLLSPKCAGCISPEGPLCGGIGKNILTVEELMPIPARCFVDELDLSEGDKKIITHPRRDGAYIALIDSLLEEEQEALQETVGFIDLGHYNFNQLIWVNTAKYLFGKEHNREPTEEEILSLYDKNNPRYRLEYMFLFPEMMEKNPKASLERIEKFRKFLSKGDEIAVENINRYRFNGACHTFRSQMRRAQIKGEPFIPSYTKVILEHQY